MKIAVLDDYQQVALKLADWSVLPANTRVLAFDDHLANPDAVKERLNSFKVVVAMRERTPFPRELLESLPALQLLVTTGMRNASIDTVAATDLGIMVCGTRSGGPSTAELAWGLILALLRHIPQEYESIRQGLWQTTLGTDLVGKTLGLLGLGNLGSHMAIIGNAFGMSVLAWSQNLTAERASKFGAALVAKDNLFAQSDVLSIHLQLSDRSRGLAGARELALMKPSAYLINTSRGPIVDETALLKTLEAHKIAGAGLDVYDEEPLPSGHPLMKLDNVVMTPHLGYVTRETYQRFYPDAVEDIMAYLSGKPTRVLNPDVLGKNRGVKGNRV
ncbi:MAG: D-2-hydroxyacid dehydrogenase family protein [Chloroflexota bacterium]